MNRPNQDPARVRRRRVAAGLEQRELARQAGISRGHMSGIESGKANASAGVLGRIARAVDCAIPDLMPVERLPRPAEDDTA